MQFNYGMSNQNLYRAVKNYRPYDYVMTEVKPLFEIVKDTETPRSPFSDQRE